MLLTVKAAAEMAGVCSGLVYIWCNEGLVHYRMGARGKRGSIRIAEADLKVWL
jgi:hypothetical protein